MAKKYAVIYFPAENIYSEIPTSWLTPDKEYCWWPNSINCKSFMTRDEPPDESTWARHRIKFEVYASTLESARRKAENPSYMTGGEELVPKIRTRKLRTISSNSSSCSETITPPPSPKKLKKKKLTSTNQLKKVMALGEQTEIPAEQEIQETIKLPNPPGQEKKKMENSTCSGNTKQLDELLVAVEKLSLTVANMQKYIISIDNRLKTINAEEGRVVADKVMENLNKNLPLTSTENVPEFDEMMENEDFKNTYVQFIKRIGGRDFKDHVNRSLPKIFTNDLGKKCSYIGLRGNYKLQKFNFMRIFVDIIMVQHSATLHEVEKSVGEWFRLSNQRKKRVEKNSKD
ncbi:unnamed protein product [Ceutorhynchus assimilis]|uniref:DUF4806 domain-containing protein n=1 Tax=Ceutorhynchus assimilis TaxID=467358 RepID=A0A9N9MJR8_9CUCU|nr:unnamed protein product [Ceutorhynchus assimilis]